MAVYGRRQPHAPLILRGLTVSQQQPPVARLVRVSPAVWQASRRPRYRTQVVRAGGQPSVARLVRVSPVVSQASRRPRYRTQIIRAGGQPSVAWFVPPARTVALQAARPRRGRVSILRWVPPPPSTAPPIGRRTGVARAAIGIRPPRVRAQIFRGRGATPCPPLPILLRRVVSSVVLYPPTVDSVTLRRTTPSVTLVAPGDGLLLVDCDSFLLVDKHNGVRLESTDLGRSHVCLRVVIREIVLRCPHQ